MLLLTREDEKFAEGTAKGRLEEKFDTARRLREMEMNDNFIHEITNLSLEEIKSI